MQKTAAFRATVFPLFAKNLRGRLDAPPCPVRVKSRVRCVKIHKNAFCQIFLVLRYQPYQRIYGNVLWTFYIFPQGSTLYVNFMRLWGVGSEMIASQASCPTPGAIFTPGNIFTPAGASGVNKMS